MITECRKCIIQALESSGIKNIYGKKEEHYLPPCAYIMLSKGKMERIGQKVAMSKDTSKARYRTKVYETTIAFTISIIAESESELDLLLEDFLINLPARILDNNENAIKVFPAAIGYDEDDSIIKDEYMALVSVEFEGGIYKDKETPLINTENIEISMEVQKDG